MAERTTGARTPSLAHLLAAEDAPTYRQLERWVELGYLKPDAAPAGPSNSRARWRWPEHEQRVARGMARLVRCGLAPAIAATIAREPRDEMCYLGEGVWVRLDAAPDELGSDPRVM